MLLSLVVFLLLLSTLVFVHELGHFLVAKWTGMRVDEFNIGFPPRLYSWRRGDTLYSLNWLLLGGYVKIHGENPQEENHDAGSFQQKSVWARLAVIIAGVAMNLLFAFVVLTVAFSVGFVSISQDLEHIPGAVIKSSQVVVAQVLPNSAAESAHLQAGDYIRSFQDPADEQVVAIKSADQLLAYTKAAQASGHLQQRLTFERARASQTAAVNLSATGPALGVAMEDLNQVRIPLWRAPGVAIKEIKYIAAITWEALRGFGSQLFIHGHLDKNVSGPVGVYKATSSAAHEGPLSVIFLAVALSINLALFNMLPIPALDGGRFVFLLTELLFRKRVIAEKVEAAFIAVSYAAILLLTVIVTIKDISNLL